MSECVKCGYKLDEGYPTCTGCGENLEKPGSFMEVLGWVISVVSSIPFIIGYKILEQKQYLPIITGGVMLFIGILLVFIGKSRSSGVESPIKEQEVES